MRRPWTKLRQGERGTVAPTVALSLVALIACGGIAFDYPRLATIDTELQDAADQAALARASQLDGQGGAVARAVAAAQGLLTNQTRLGNDTCGVNVETGLTTSACGTSTSGSAAQIFFYATNYCGAGLGYVGDPNGMAIAPLVTVKLTGVQFRPLSFLMLAHVNMPDFATTLTYEDSSGTASN